VSVGRVLRGPPCSGWGALWVIPIVIAGLQLQSPHRIMFRLRSNWVCGRMAGTKVEYHMLFRRRASLLVAVIQPWPNVAQWPRGPLFYTFLCHLAVRRAFRVLTFCRPRLYIRATCPGNRHFGISPSPGPGVCGARDVGCVTFVYRGSLRC